MSTSIIPTLVDALIEACTNALPSAAVHDGYGVSGDLTDNLMIGVDNPFSDQAAPTATSSQGWANVGSGRSRDESGDIACVAYATSGDTDQKQVRDAAFAITAAVEGVLRTDPTLGIGDFIYTEFGTDHEFMQDQDADGAFALIAFSVHFNVRL